jgi:Zn-dependent M28 family amino/carboxypeptidase
LPAFELPVSLEGRIITRSADIESANVLAVLPGSDPTLRNEYLVVGAHLDGYGYGTPINGDGLYNGTFDDAAYVATLVRLAEQRRGRGFRRSVLFAAFTGEEKGLLGARAFLATPPLPRERLVGMINLDQLRPIFPLELLTIHGRDDSSLGQAAQAVATEMNIRTRLDPEPERGLIMRADHWPFLQANIPAVNFVFGYEPGSEAERRYRLWYRTRYHHPADDLTQPWDPAAAARMNTFFYRLAERAANSDARPHFLGQNPYGAASSR